MTRNKTLVVLLVIFTLLAALLAWRFIGGTGGAPELDESTRDAMLNAARMERGDPDLAAYLEAHDADSLSEKAFAELILEYQREREAAAPEAEQGSAREPIDG